MKVLLIILKVLISYFELVSVQMVLLKTIAKINHLIAILITNFIIISLQQKLNAIKNFIKKKIEEKYFGIKIEEFI